MTNVLPNPGQDGLSIDRYANYDELMAAVKAEAASNPESQPIPLETYADTAHQIENTRAYYQRQQVSVSEQLAGLKEIYVEDATDKRLAGFAAMLIDAPVQLARDARLDQLKATPNRTANERAQVSELGYAACEYNHLVADVVLDGRSQFDRATLTSWMSAAAGPRNPRWARDTLAGALGEVALYDALRVTPGIEEPHLTDTATDRAGIDVRARYGTLELGFDSKFDRKVDETIWKEVGRDRILTTTMTVPVEAIEDLGVSEWGRRELPKRILAIAKRGM